MSTTATADRPERMRVVQPDRGSDDLERCLEVGQKVLRLLEKGVHRVEVYRYADTGRERIEGVKLAS